MRTKSGFATVGMIRSIDFARSGIDGTGSLSPRARRTLAVYVVLVKMGFTGIAAPMGAIADAVYRSSHGEARSIRTLQRANSELVDRGYIQLATTRIGCFSKSSKISFCIGAFSYWTGRSHQNVSPLHTQSHSVVSRDTSCDKKPHTTNWRTSDRTRDLSQVTPLSNTKEDKEQRAGARAVKKHSRRKRNPVLFSVVMAISKSGAYRSDKRAARARAECEIRAIAAGVELVNPSGVDWGYWEKRWQDMSIPVRENTATREIVPLLLPKPKQQLKSAIPIGVEQLEGASPTPDQIRRVREQLEESVSIPAPAPTPSKPLAENNALEGDDLAILIAARARARINGM